MPIWWAYIYLLKEHKKENLLPKSRFQGITSKTGFGLVSCSSWGVKDISWIKYVLQNSCSFRDYFYDDLRKCQNELYQKSLYMLFRQQNRASLLNMTENMFCEIPFLIFV